MKVKYEKLNTILREYQLYQLIEYVKDNHSNLADEKGLIDTNVVETYLIGLIESYNKVDTEDHEHLEDGKKIMKETKGGTVVPLNDDLDPMYSKSEIIYARDVICEYYRMQDALNVWDILFFF